MRKGDGKTVGCIVGEQIADLPIGSGGLGTIKVVGKGFDAVSDAGKLAGENHLIRNSESIWPAVTSTPDQER